MWQRPAELGNKCMGEASILNHNHLWCAKKKKQWWRPFTFIEHPCDVLSIHPFTHIPRRRRCGTGATNATYYNYSYVQSQWKARETNLQIKFDQTLPTTVSRHPSIHTYYTVTHDVTSSIVSVSSVLIPPTLQRLRVSPFNWDVCSTPAQTTFLAAIKYPSCIIVDRVQHQGLHFKILIWTDWNVDAFHQNIIEFNLIVATYKFWL